MLNQYLQTSELSTYSPQVTIPTATAQQRGLIYTASRLIDGLVGRAAYGLSVRNIMNAQVNMDLNLTGILPSDPVRRFIGTTGSVIIPGASTTQSVELADFDIEYETGIIKYKRLLYGSGAKWTSPGSSYYDGSIYANTISPYHSGLIEVIDDNSFPYQLTVSFRAGFFTTVNISATGAAGTDQVTVSDTSDLQVGQEFSFSSDITNEAAVDGRFITAIDTTNNIVTFTPSVSYALTTSMTLRQIDNAVKVATGLIITDLITFPAGGLTAFMKNLGRSALVKSWERSAKTTTYNHVMGMLSTYIR